MITSIKGKTGGVLQGRVETQPDQGGLELRMASLHNKSCLPESPTLPYTHKAQTHIVL